MSDTGFAKAGLIVYWIHWSCQETVTIHLTLKKITFVGPPIDLVPSVSSSLGRDNVRNFKAELEEQADLGVITDNSWKELDTDLSPASEIKLIEADFTFKLLNHGRLYIQFT